MKLTPFAPCLAFVSLAFSSLSADPAVLNIRYDGLVEYSGEKAEYLAKTVLRNDRSDSVNYTTEGGTWRVQNIGTWTSGFVPGLYWYLYAMTGDSKWQNYAEHWTEGVRPRATATDNDTGFQIFESFGLGYMFAEENQAAYLPVLLTGAETLVEERYNIDIGAFRSWDQNVDNITTLPFEVNIDQMMNLELILWASQNGGPEVYEDYAIQHADTTWTHNVREDGGTYHVVAYNLDGTVDYKRTHQGWQETSTWSRGQAWAVYGYTMVYRYTGLPRMLDRAFILYDYFMQETHEDADDFVPYSDFDAPLDSRNPRDASAAAIVAAAALELYTITGATQFVEDAESILTSLSGSDYLSEGTSYQSIILKASEKWGRGEVGAIFADFYFLEALYRWRALEREGSSSGESWASFPMSNNRYVDTGDWIGWLDVSFAPHVYVYDLDDWVYLTEAQAAGNRGGWLYIYK